MKFLSCADVERVRCHCGCRTEKMNDQGESLMIIFYSNEFAVTPMITDAFR